MSGYEPKDGGEHGTLLKLAESDLELMANAYVDGQLSAQQRRTFEKQCERNPELRLMVDDYIRLNETLRRMHTALLQTPASPDELTALRGRGRSWTGGWSTAVAAGLAGIVIGAAVGWFGAVSTLSNTMSPQADVPKVLARPVAQEAALAHAIYTREKRHAVEVRAADSRHLNTWLSKRLAQSVTAPDLRSLGFDLVGGRLLADAGKPAAQFMFENADKQRLTLFIRSFVDRDPASRDAHAPAFISTDSLGVWFWPQSGLYYALTGALDKADLRLVVQHIRDSSSTQTLGSQ